jgi:predicted transcriptional regulator
MRLVWSKTIREPFIVWDVNERLPELAYTTVMTTVQRLAEKGLLQVEHAPPQRALLYRSAGTPHDFLKQASRDQAARLVQAFGPIALAAFQAELERLSPDQRNQLQDLVDD